MDESERTIFANIPAFAPDYVTLTLDSGASVRTTIEALEDADARKVILNNLTAPPVPRFVSGGSNA